MTLDDGDYGTGQKISGAQKPVEGVPEGVSFDLAAECTGDELLRMGYRVDEEGIVRRHDRDTDFGAMTSQQRKFAEAYVFQGMTKVGAYLQAYDCADDRNARRNAAVASQQPHIASYIYKLQCMVRGQSTIDWHRINNSIVNELVEQLENAEKTADRRKAAVDLAKMQGSGLYDKLQDSEQEGLKLISQTELDGLIGTLLQRVSSIDGTTNPPTGSDKS